MQDMFDFQNGQQRRLKNPFREIFTIGYHIALPNVNQIESSGDLKPAVYNEPENEQQKVAPPKVLQVQQVQQYEEIIETPTPTRMRRRTSASGTSSAFCCCFLTLLTLVFIFLCFLAYRKHIHLNGELKDFKSIRQIELKSNNLPAQPNIRGGTVILHSHDGSKGIIDQSSFSLMAGQVTCTSSLRTNTWDNGNYSILGITKDNLFGADDCPKFKVTNLKCNGREKSIEQCSYTLKYASCSDIKHAAGVACKSHIGREVTSQVSLLLGGKNHYEGDIMALNEQLVFGPVCDVGFGYNEAMTVCKDLGVNRAKFMSSGSYFRPKDQTYSGFSVIYLHCGEDDDHLLDCYIDNRERKCESEGSAGVICSEN